MFWSCHILNFWFPWLTDFCSNIRNVLKWGGSKCQNIASLRAKITIFSNIKHIIKLKEIPRNGVNWCIEIAPNDFEFYKC